MEVKITEKTDKKKCDKNTEVDYKTLYKNLCSVITNSTNIPIDVVRRKNLTDLEKILHNMTWHTELNKKIKHAVSSESYTKFLKINTNEVEFHSWKVYTEKDSAETKLNKIDRKIKNVLDSNKYIYETIVDGKDPDCEVIITRKARILTLEKDIGSLREEIRKIKKNVCSKRLYYYKFCYEYLKQK